jgi:hypothetical protein
MMLLSGLFDATNTTIREGRAALPDFVFGVLWRMAEFRSIARKVASLGFAVQGKYADKPIWATPPRNVSSLPFTGGGTAPLYRKTPRPWWLGYIRFSVNMMNVLLPG